MNNNDTLFEDENKKTHLIARAESLFKLGDTSCTKHTRPKTQREMLNRDSFGNTMKYGTLISKEKEKGILLIR